MLSLRGRDGIQDSRGRDSNKGDAGIIGVCGTRSPIKDDKSSFNEERCIASFWWDLGM